MTPSPDDRRLPRQVNAPDWLRRPKLEIQWKVLEEGDTLSGKMGSAMQNVANRRWLLKSYPEGMPSPENWTMDVQPVPDPPGLEYAVILPSDVLKQKTLRSRS